ncbi:hypothetical protein Q3G72_023886 [Acer saccharum]|nr:hypothetical protein Q3G72_023886 [Acer saccharum]
MASKCFHYSAANKILRSYQLNSIELTAFFLFHDFMNLKVCHGQRLVPPSSNRDEIPAPALLQIISTKAMFGGVVEIPLLEIDDEDVV